MKKITLVASALFVVLGANAQIFSDDFESYSAGYLGPQSLDWTTWSNADGTTEDVNISTAMAQSGTQSIYFSSTATAGGPQDVILELDQVYTSGIFTFQTGMLVPNGKAAHLNFQKSAVPGVAWTLNVTADNGSLVIDDAITDDLATATYTQGAWFNLKIEANLTLGLWEAFIDGTSIGTWINGTNQVAAVDFYPPSNLSQFYIDDVSFDHTTYTLPNNNAALSGLNTGSNIVGYDGFPTVTVLNAGVNVITSFDVTIDYNGSQFTETVTGQNLASMSSMEVLYTNPLTFVAGMMPVTATVSNVNGNATDDNPSDDAVTISINPIVPAAGKVVVGEEATGTSCPWCPSGAVFMDKFEQDFGPYWAGIAVHNNDPMTNAAYDAGIGALIGGYPSSLVDRGAEVDPSAMATDFFDRLQIPPVAFISTTSTWDAATRELVVTVSADFQSAANSNYKLAVALTEDDVTGTASGYDQSNAYAGGGNGVMGGYELLPISVPASQMVYNHVARGIEPSFGGDATSFPATVAAGEVHSKTYTFTLPATWDEQKIHIIGMMMNPTGRIDNASKSGIDDLAALTDLEQAFKGFSVYPNPASTYAIVEIQLETISDVQMRLIDMSGKEIAARNYGALEVSSTIQLNTLDLNSGIYLVELTVNGQRMTKRLVIE